MWMFLLVLLQYSLNVFVDIRRSFNLETQDVSQGQSDRRGAYRSSEVQHGLASDERFLMIILDFDIDDVYGSIVVASSREQILGSTVHQREWHRMNPAHLHTQHRNIALHK
jgi:hypothetical protein